jgi:hypothetical protein
MKIGDVRPVEIPIVRCPDCGIGYALEVPLFSMRGEPEWIYVARCKHKPKNMHQDFDEMEYARLNVARICAVREPASESERAGVGT